jgi:hypothetical protein
MAFLTPARTNNPNTCHNTSVPEDPSPPVLSPSSALLRTRSERLNGASSIQQEEASHHSPFITPSSLPTRRTHTTPVRVRPIDDETRKRKSVCTPTGPTTVPNEVSTPSNRPQQTLILSQCVRMYLSPTHLAPPPHSPSCRVLYLCNSGKLCEEETTNNGV